ncbi:MAG: N-acetylneuraminate synthase family protein [Deltaproteobacteria bacterium]|nr:N-acetylneuraminate synthase family protein [Deltaproteobacteria bacterium]
MGLPAEADAPPRQGRALIIAETASSHEGRLDLARQLTEAAAAAGADAIKFQVFVADELVTVDHLKYPAFKQLELDPAQWAQIVRWAEAAGLAFFADVFDTPSFRLMEDLGAAAYKIHSTNLTHDAFLAEVASAGKAILLAAGGGTDEDLAHALKVLESGGRRDIILLHGYQAYPTPVEDTQLRRMARLRERFRRPVGLSDHVDAESPLAVTLPAIAVGMGAVAIEKHLTMDRELRGRDYYSALNPSEFARMVELIRLVERALGAEGEEVPASERQYQMAVEKHIVAREAVPPGTPIRLEMLALKRTPSRGLSAAFLGVVTGRRARRALERDQPILLEDLEDDERS